MESVDAGARSIEAARRTLAQLGLSASESDLDAIADELLGEFELLDTCPLPADVAGRRNAAI